MRIKFAYLLPIVVMFWIASGGSAAAQGRTGMERVPGTMTGTVTDESGATLAGVTVKIFEEGMKLTETTTGADGRYRLEFDYIPDIDWTLLVWLMPSNGETLPGIVILRESLKSKELELWSPCLPRIELKSRMKYNTELLTDGTTQDRMSELDCLKE